MDTLKDFAKKLHSAFPTLKAVALSPYIPGERDASFDEDGFPFLNQLPTGQSPGVCDCPPVPTA